MHDSILRTDERETVRQRLAGLIHPVRLVFFTQTIGAPETARITRQILDELASLNELVTVEEVNFVLEKDRALALGIEGVPAIALLANSTDTRMRFLGAPSGYEFLSLIDALIIAGTGESGLSDAGRELVAAVTTPLDIKVFVTPTCPHCPRAVTMAHRMAHQNSLITATCIEATEFLDLSRQFRVTGVPKTVVNGSIEILGALPETEFLEAVVGRDSSTGIRQNL